MRPLNESVKVVGKKAHDIGALKLSRSAMCSNKNRAHIHHKSVCFVDYCCLCCLASYPCVCVREISQTSITVVISLWRRIIHFMLLRIYVYIIQLLSKHNVKQASQHSSIRLWLSRHGYKVCLTESEHCAPCTLSILLKTSMYPFEHGSRQGVREGDK